MEKRIKQLEMNIGKRARLLGQIDFSNSGSITIYENFNIFHSTHNMSQQEIN